ncbi:UNVERIFIED_ORG: hypothetical protein ABIB52_004360, partial [Arthrobacter sp. UYCu721]
RLSHFNHHTGTNRPGTAIASPEHCRNCESVR